MSSHTIFFFQTLAVVQQVLPQAREVFPDTFKKVFYDGFEVVMLPALQGGQKYIVSPVC